MNAIEATQSGASVVITHLVREGMDAAYLRWLDEIGPLCRASPGHLDWHLVRPIAGLTRTYTAIIRFDTPEHLRQWMESDARRRLVERVRPMLAADDAYSIRTGLDFWFDPAPDAKPPVRWKQFAVTWSAIFPLVYLTSLALAPMFAAIGVTSRAPTTLVGTGLVCALMTYVVMPRYTRLVRGWLYR